MHRIAALLLAAAAAGHADVDVPGTANIFSAGRAEVPDFPGGGGTLAIETSLDGATAVEFLDASGLTNCCSGAPNTGPDGGGDDTDIDSYEGISGILVPRHLFLAGVFLGDDEPTAPAPERLNFNDVGLDFQTLAPELGQTFFIGDGHTSAGQIQTFEVPDGATRVFVGFADGVGFSGPPGYYDDNTGALSVFVCTGQGCPPDVNGDGFLSVLDFIAFQQAFVNAEPIADCDANGEFNILDFVCYQQLFVAGCD